MKRHTLLAVAVGLLVAADAPKDDAKNDLKKFQGTWQVTTMEVDGQKMPAEEAKNFQVIIKGDKYTLKNMDNIVSEGTVKLDPSKKPRAIDITPMEGDGKGQSMLGIYEIDSETQKVCYAQPDQKRPAKFVSEAGSGNTLIVLKKAKP